MMQAAFCLLCSKRSRTGAAPTPDIRGRDEIPKVQFELE
jgi:hypothetical protein